ncbi:MAG TPA: type II toxin-antitoxin system VapB family antitoxin, partial [Geminicoccaceae bacterium]
ERSTITEAVGRALRERCAELRRREEVDRRVREIQAEVAKLPVLDPRDHGEMLYDEDGLPR